MRFINVFVFVFGGCEAYYFGGSKHQEKRRHVNERGKRERKKVRER
jgi:hypothetical protein